MYNFTTNLAKPFFKKNSLDPNFTFSNFPPENFHHQNETDDQCYKVFYNCKFILNGYLHLATLQTIRVITPHPTPFYLAQTSFFITEDPPLRPLGLTEDKLLAWLQTSS
jgi:hypothetical protein